jgi:serine/threonine protein phosphatase 1
MARVILIGDLQGMHDEALALLDRCKATADDWVIFLGDLVDRGDESGKCLDLAMRTEARQGKPACILGNHEARHLDHEDDFIRTGKVPSMPPTHVATRMQLRPEHYVYMRRLPPFIRLPEHNVVAVHAGVFPGRTIEQQDRHHLLHLQMIKPPGTKTLWPSRVPPDERDTWKFWTHFWDGPETIVFGHSVLDKPLVTDKVVGIDGGACFGRQLHAYVLPDREIVTVKSSRDFSRGKRGTQSSGIKTFLVHGDVSTYS